MPASKPICKGTHKGHLCVLASAGRIEAIQALAAKPKFICFNCGRVAKAARHLCNPMPLADKP